MLNTLSDIELIEQIKASNMAAFRALYYRHVNTVFSLVSRLLGLRRGEAEDVTQEVFIQVHRSLSRFEGSSSFATWLHRVTVNVCCSHMRRRSLRTESVENSTVKELVVRENREAHIDARRQLRRMFQFLDDLSIKNRLVFTLYEFQGLSLQEISDVLEIPLHTAASRLRRSRESLMRSIVKEHESMCDEGGR